MPERAPLTPSRANLYLLFALLAVAAIFFGHFTFGRLPVSSDMSMMYAPFYSMKWDRGIPLWNPYLACGMPMDGNLQFSAAYPLRWPFFFISDWRRFFSLFMFLHYVVALAGTAGALRAMGFSRIGSFAGAVVFACGGYMVGRIINTTIFMASCWFPWMVWGAVASGPIAGPIAALGIAMVMWTGSPHLMAYGSIGFGLAWAVMNIGKPDGFSIAPPSPLFLLHRMRTWFYFASGGIAGLSSLIPGMMQVRQSVRTETDIANNLADSLRWGDIPTALLGGAGGFIYPERNDIALYAGGAAWFLILLAASRTASWRDRRWWCGLTLTLAGLALALGDSIGWQYILPYIPGLKLLEGPARALVLTAFGLSILLPCGLDSISAITRRHLVIISGCTWLLMALLAAFFARGLHWNEGIFDALLGWLIVPGSALGQKFTVLNLPLVLLPAILFALLWPCARPGLAVSLALLLVLDLAHFAPRVAPHTVPLDYFDPSPQVKFLTDQKIEGQYRIVGYDVLQFHDTEWDSLHKFEFLTTNLATLYRLEDIRAFDPLTSKEYKEHFIERTGRVPFNDPIRNLDMGKPDEEILRDLNVRYLIGNPYDRRVTNYPTVLTQAQPKAEITALIELHETASLSAWSFVSLIDAPGTLRSGEQIARLIIESDEGSFEFPVHYGIETGHIRAPVKDVSSETPIPHMTWKIFTPYCDENYRETNTNYRGTIGFGRPLHVRRAHWELTRRDLVFFVAAQACRLSAPDPDPTWRRVFDHPVAPIYEFLPARPRIELLTADATRSASGEVVATSRSANSRTYETKTAAPVRLLIREASAPGWRARIDGIPAPIEGTARSQIISVPRGSHRIDLRYSPKPFFLTLALSAFAILAVLASYFYERKSSFDRSISQ